MFNKIKKFIKSHCSRRLIVNTAVSYVFVLLPSIAAIVLGKIPMLTALCTAAIFLYIPAVLLVGISVHAVRGHSDLFDDPDSPLSENATLDVLSRVKEPVLIMDEDGTIVWFNRNFSERSGLTDSIYGEDINRICGISAADILESSSDEGIDHDRFGKSWSIKGYRMSPNDKGYVMTFWHDRSEVVSLYHQIENTASVVAYVMIDNLDELMQYVQAQYRTVAGQVEAVLKEWAEAAGGIFKEYERDRYIFIFEAAHLKEFSEKKYDILDRVRDIRVGDGNLPVTVSIGISGAIGSLADKERAARGALDMALQRGGDQVVVRSESGLEFYGGRSKGVSKRTKVRARVVANALATAISGSSNVLIMGHRGADFDSLGACVGIARLAMFCGVKVNIIVNDRDPNLRKALDKLRSIPEYLGIFVNAANAQDMITSETLLVVCDVNNRDKFEAPEVADNVLNTVIIDHHRKTAEYEHDPLITYIEPSASSACELVVEILEQSIPAGSLPKEEADILFAGILLDTKQFSRNTHTRTFSAALYLRGEGADPADIEELFKTELDDFIREAKFEIGAELYRSVIAISTSRGGQGSTFDRIAAAKAADKLLGVEDVEASFVLCPVDDYVHISARSAGAINVQLITEKIGGGGRFDVAATQLEGVSVEEAKMMLMGAIDSYLDEI